MKRERRRLTALVLALCLALSLLAGCGAAGSFKTISMEEGKKRIDAGTDALILDVRTQEEYDAGHIPDAVLLPIEEIREGNLEPIPDKDQTIMVYCWTGRRAEDASQILADQGYTNIICFGGLVDWLMLEEQAAG